MHRFRLDAEAAARLDHQNIVPIYEIGEHEGQHFYSMKLLSGGGSGLAQLALPQGLTPSESRTRQAAIAWLMAKVAGAVHYAHQHGVLHRDLKPTNILLDSQGEPHVSDFGLAKLVESEEGLTVSGAPLGTPGYMSPEQATGGAKDASTASDVYSLGAILHELLTGRAPFAGPTPLETIRLVVDTEPVKPRSVNVQIDRDLETICLKCLTKEPQGRYPSAAFLAEDLEHWRAGEPIMARPAGMFEKLWSRARRDPKLAALVLLTVFSLAIISVGSTAAALRIHRAEQADRENLYQAYLAQARAQRISGQEGQRFGSLEAIRKAAAIHRSTAVVDEAIAALALPDLMVRKSWRVPSHLQAEYVYMEKSLEFYVQKDPDGVRLKSVADNREVMFLPVNHSGYRDLRFIGMDRSRHYLAADRLATNDELHYLVWDLHQSGALVFDRVGLGADLSADGRLALRTAGTIAIHDLASGKEIGHFRQCTNEWSPLAFSRSGKYLACYDDGDSDVEIWDLKTDQLALRLAHSNVLSGLGWNDDDSLLATGCRNGVITVWRVKDGARLAQMSGHLSRIAWLAFDHRNDLLASTGWDATLRLWDLASGRQLLVSDRAAPQLRFGPDDKTLGYAVQGDECQLLEVVRGSSAWRPRRSLAACRT